MPAGGAACSSCIYWDLMGDGSIGKCRKNAPPVPFSSPAPGASHTGQYTTNNTYWPVTAAADWCGEYSNVPGPGRAVVKRKRASKRR